MELSDKQKRFIAEYLVDLNAAAAAVRCGYSPRSARITASRLMDIPEIQAAVTAGKAQQLAETTLSATRVLEELRRIAFLDIRSFYDADGNLKSPKEWSIEQGAAVASFESLIKNTQAGDGITDTIHKVRLVDKTRALESLAKHFGLLTEKLEHGGAIRLIHELGDDDRDESV